MKMSVEELRARVAELTTKIELQKTLLKDLEKEKSSVLRKLNSVFDPVARLPLELSTEIFLQTLPIYPKPGVNHAPMLFLNICHAWAEIALSLSPLWASIGIDLPRAEGFDELLQVWFQRAGNRFLSVSIRGFFDDKGVSTVIWQYGTQLKHLELCEGNDPSTSDDEDRESMALTGRTPPGPLPSLETLTIRGGNAGRGVAGLKILELLHLAPNLAEFVLDDVNPMYDLYPNTQPHVHQSLRRLLFGASGKRAESDDLVFKVLTLPALETLSLAMRDVNLTDLAAFLQRSSPPLRELALGHVPDVEFIHLDGCLRIVPTLIAFELWWPPIGSIITEEFVKALAESPTLLPNLQTLTLHLRSAIYDAFWDNFLRALSARRTQLKVVYVDIEEEKWQPEWAVMEAIREMEMDGMQIYIGETDVHFNLVTCC
ncbi:hypothetical protein DFH06DRAFT_773949 [Mycena polygramma]|nr:hypothetical protein DFH06DRAFT_773949 [Mycena polygramma]